MSAGWEVGDLALCVADRLPPPYSTRRSKIVRMGRVYTVTSVRWSITEQCIALGLDGAKSKGPIGDWHACCFRKVTPPKADEFDREVIELMNGKPVPVEA